MSTALPAAWWRLSKQVATSWLDDYVPSMGAALAYYTIFSLAPLLLIVVSVAGLVFGEDAARGEIQSQLQDLMGERGAGAVQNLLANARQPSESLAATAIGLVILLVGATTVFAELQDALDRIWRVPGRLRERGWLTIVRARLMAFGMILAGKRLIRDVCTADQ
jgi:membrane protein